MKKNELKSGMIVEYRCGDKRLILGDKLIGDDAYTSLPNFNDDLKHILYSDLDIIKVYNYKFAGNFSQLLEDDNLVLIWEHDEIKELEKQEKLLKLYKKLAYYRIRVIHKLLDEVACLTDSEKTKEEDISYIFDEADSYEYEDKRIIEEIKKIEELNK